MALLRWRDLPDELREPLQGKLVGLWGAPSDEYAFDSFTIDKQQALLLIMQRMRDKELWRVVRTIENSYGEGGVGIGFTAWPLIESTLTCRKDFTRSFAKHNHPDMNGAFYERDRAEAAFHFLYREGTPRKWNVHFDLYSPVHSLSSSWKHFRYEYLGGIKPDWRMIRRSLQGAANKGR